jgi:glycosyltransferase EpsD
MKKILFVANISKHIIRFHLPYLKWFQENGYETHVAANGSESIPYCDFQHNIPIQRSPFSLKNIANHFVLKKIIDTNHFQIVHGHTPMGGVLARTASINARKNGTKVLYTAHGFHFYYGSSVLNWILYYPVEKYLSKYTDGIITINKEDFDLLDNKKFKSKSNYQINGIGIDTSRFNNIDFEKKTDIRIKNHFIDNDFILLYVAELIPRKNHEFIIESSIKLVSEIPNVKILFAGRGILTESLKKLVVNNQLTNNIFFLGFRNDIDELIVMSDVGISASKQEGLGLNLAEEMLCGLPVVASEDRGHKEMVIQGYNGFLFKQNNISEFIDFVTYLYRNPDKRIEMGKNACESIQKFKLENSLEAMSNIYRSFLD